ncbi:MAG TPA: hypothetical protein VIL98_01645 [Gaiellaceae bacterium]
MTRTCSPAEAIRADAEPGPLKVEGRTGGNELARPLRRSPPQRQHHRHSLVVYRPLRLCGQARSA